MTPHISTLKLHQLRLGELENRAAEPLNAHLAQCALCQARAGHQHSNRAEFQAMPEPLGLGLVLHPRTVAPHRRWAPAVVSVVSLAAAILLVVRVGVAPDSQPLPHDLDVAGPAGENAASGPVVSDYALAHADRTASGESTPVTPTIDVPIVAPERGTPSSEPGKALPAEKGGTRSKGVASPRLEAWVQAGDSARPLYTGESLGAGSRVQLRYDAMGKRFVTLAGRDSNGVVEIYGTLTAGDPGLHSAPFALTLDDSQGEQVFFAIATDLRPDPANLQALLGQNPVRMDGAVITSLVLRKD